MLTTVIFDLDDTLYDEIDFCRSGFRAAAEHVATLSDNLTPQAAFETIWRCFIRGDCGSTFNAALAELGIPIDPPLIHKLVEIYRTHRPTLTLPADSRAVLDELKGRYTLALLTDGYLPTQRLKVEALGIEHDFKSILYTEELGREHWKPSPLGFQRLLETLDARPQEAVYVADNQSKDFIGPNRLGMLTIQVARPGGLYHQPSPLPDAAPKRTIVKLGNLARVLSEY
ncbi:MAG: HAD family hydrolase [Solirubrobacterales bacterium]